MVEPYVGEIRMFAGNFAPAGWMFCHGQLLSIWENDMLFSLIGTIYGGDGVNTFALPDLRGRAPVHMGQLSAGNKYILGEMGGVEKVTLTVNQIPAHHHIPQASTLEATTSSPQHAVWAKSNLQPYGNHVNPNARMANECLGRTGGNQPHNNLMPYLAINYIISLFGIFPSQT
ncbi:phage tail protein [Ammoniphilus sp. CFH 90114]|uniref:phage tail protein n=1 Tax=Ammoniphilus sp. CFH 90114 TaxID=2493665 RepID=UPI00100F5D8A|nr:tail fiber protein [Ammoniphilus sp. CFH 90114]RXT04271.1 phage tail protein [Ammoniphilus sp. CFH 90114]